jgi:hypothetical protein
LGTLDQKPHSSLFACRPRRDDALIQAMREINQSDETRIASTSRWREVSTPKLLGFLAGAGVFGCLILISEPGFVPVVDHANLMFHEAGHPIVGLLVPSFGVYGGTMGQLAFPVVLAISFWRQRQAPSFAASVVWFFQNWLNIARYMADARAQQLPLLGGGDHDWARIFGNWGLLAHDTQIAAVVRSAGWIGMSTACAWVVFPRWLSGNRPGGDPSTPA